jgi:tRNA-splicing ligase RtcB
VTEKFYDLTVFGEADENTLRQARNCLDIQVGAKGVLCADNHLGYAQPVGMAIAYRNRISVSGVGYDIGCGNKAVLTNLMADEVDVPAMMDLIFAQIAFGVGEGKGEFDHPVLDKIRDADFKPQRALLDKAAKQLGSVGGGNHYVDLFEDEKGRLWIGVHFGSRGFGHTTANGFLWMAKGKPFQTRGEAEAGLFDPPVTFATESFEGEAYISAMELAGEYAYAGRDVVVEKVLSILGAKAEYEVHNHHNYAWVETHGGEKFWVVRKGCTPAFPGQAGFVGATMGEESVILEGTEAGVSDQEVAVSRLQEAALFSTVHGAGRVMSRTRAAGKSKNRWTCLNRDCDWFQPPSTHKPADGNCPRCGHPKLAKRMQQVAPGELDWQAEYAKVTETVELRGSGAEEAPGAYKRLDEVLDAQGGTIMVRERLRPLGVAMAPVGVPADD